MNGLSGWRRPPVEYDLTIVISMDIEVSWLGRRAAIHAALGDRHRLAIVDALRLSDRSPTELQETTGLSSNLLTFHLDVLERAGVIARLHSQGDSRRRYVTLTGPVPSLCPPSQVNGEEVLFVCTANSARSQFASFLWSARTGRRPLSAGTRPAPRVHPLAVAVAGRHGLDVSRSTPRHLGGLDLIPDLVVSVCDRAKESGLGSASPSLHWSIPDPEGGDEAEFERAFQQISARVDRLVAATRAAGDRP